MHLIVQMSIRSDLAPKNGMVKLLRAYTWDEPEVFELGKDKMNGNVRNDQEKQEIIKV
jgi:hypothetical protein